MAATEQAPDTPGAAPRAAGPLLPPSTPDPGTADSPSSAPAPPEPDEVMILPPDPDRTLRWLAVLSAAGFRYRLEESAEGWRIFLPVSRAAAAQRELAEYERANQNWPPPPPEAADYLLYPEESVASFTVAMGLLIFYSIVGPADALEGLAATGSADSARIVAGEWWRAVTALTLHADPAHVLGNALCCFFFGQAVARHLGSGLGWVMILATGALGNLAAAWLSGQTQTSVGASTATFGALGILSAYQFVRNYRRYGNLRSIWSRAWIPAAAGVAMLGLMGTSPRADLLGHFYGFAVGVVLGLASGLWLRRSLPEYAQYLLFAAFTAALIDAWQFARP